MDEFFHSIPTKLPVVLSHIMVLTFSVPHPWRRGEVLQEEVIHYMPPGLLHPLVVFRESKSWTTRHSEWRSNLRANLCWLFCVMSSWESLWTCVMLRDLSPHGHTYGQKGQHAPPAMCCPWSAVTLEVATYRVFELCCCCKCDEHTVNGRLQRGSSQTSRGERAMYSSSVLMTQQAFK